MKSDSWNNPDNWIYKWTEKLYNTNGTQGQRKLLVYFNDTAHTPHFQDLIKSLRKKYDIPATGFLSKDMQVSLPEQWKHKQNNSVHIKLNEDIKSICKLYFLHPVYWSDTIQNIIFYDKYDVIGDMTEGFDLCLFTNLRSEHKEFLFKKIIKNDDIAFPLAIRISPYASERDILDYVKKMYPVIKHFQEDLKDKTSKIGKIKKKKAGIKERNDFIYQNKHLPREEIMKLVGDKFGYYAVIDYGYIGKIISMEKKKRKDV